VRRRILTIFCVLHLFLFSRGFSQTVTVVDSEDLKPISDMAVMNELKTKFIYTNRSGKADISYFSEK